MVMTSTISLVLEVMSSTPVCVQRQTTLSELLELFDRFDYNAFPVVEDPSTNVLEGIVTKLDVLRALRADQAEREVMKIEVGEIMRPGVVNIEGDIPIDVAADLMIQTNLRSLPVVYREHGKPPIVAGIVSRGDLIRGLRARTFGNG